MRMGHAAAVRWSLVLALGVCLAVSASSWAPRTTSDGISSANPVASSAVPASSQVPAERAPVVGTSTAATPLTVVPESSLVYTLDDARSVPFVSVDAMGTTGLLWTGDPYVAGGSLALTTLSPYSYSDVVLNYTTGTNRTFVPTPGIIGGYSYPGSAFAVNRSGSLYLYTLNDFAGQGNLIYYGGADLVWPLTNVMDFPRFANVTMVNLRAPATSLGYTSGEALWADLSYSRDGDVVAGMTDVSAYIGNPPAARYLYVANLSTAAYANSSRPSTISPLKQIPWNAPIGVGHFYQVSSNLILHIPWAPSAPQWVLFDVLNNTWKNYTVPGWNVIWSGHLGSYLYLLIQTVLTTTQYSYVMDRIDTSQLTKLSSVTTMPVATLFNTTFNGSGQNFYVDPVFRGHELDFLAGTGGYPPVFGPELFYVRAYDWTTGAPAYNATLNAPLPGSAWVLPAEYPSPGADVVFGGGLFDLVGNRIIPLDSAALRTFVDNETVAPSCAQCQYTFWATGVNATTVWVAGLREDFTNRTTRLFSLRVLLGHRPPAAVFTVTPTLGNETTLFAVDASAVSSPYQTAATLQVRWDWNGDGTWDTNWTTVKTAQHGYASDGVYTVILQVRDSLGVTNRTTHAVAVDGTPPVVGYSLLGTPGQAGWFVTQVTVAFNATDAVSGVASVSVRVDGGPWATTPGGSVSVTVVNGRHTIAYYATDHEGNVEPVRTLSVNVDTDLPAIRGLAPTGTVSSADVAITWKASDNTSGVAQTLMGVDGGAYAPVGNGSATLHLADGTHTVRILVKDVAGNAVSAAVTFRVDTYVFSFTGPYYGIPLVLVVAGIALAPPLLFLLSERLRRRRR